MDIWLDFINKYVWSMNVSTHDTSTQEAEAGLLYDQACLGYGVRPNLKMN